MNKAQEAFKARLKRGWTPQDWRHRRVWFFPSERRLWEASDTASEHAMLAAHPDAIRMVESGCPKCWVGYADVMADPAFACEVCAGTGFPVFGSGS